MNTLDVEGFLVEILEAALPTTTIYDSLPTGHVVPASFVVVRRIGGAATSRVQDVPMVAIEAYARARADALSLCGQARAVLHGLSGEYTHCIVYRVAETGGPVNLPDPRILTHYRYTVTAQIWLRA